MFPSSKMEEYIKPELSGIFWAKMVVKNRVLGSSGTHFMHTRVKNVLRVTEIFCIILILNILSSKYFAESFGAFFTLKFLSNTDTTFCTFWLFTRPWCNFSCKFSIIGLNSDLNFSCKVLSLHLRQEIFMFSCKVLFLEIGWFNFQENIVVLVRRLKFFSAGFCIFQLVTCGGEVIFHISSRKSNFEHMRRK